MQILCQTLEPTEGSIKINGRVGALLELGSGFNPEFTGIENIYLNATLLGLKRREIEERIDDILSFADIGESINQEIRTYSSGMIVRLAFAVIANIKAELLVIDEALAVGDAYFTQKCMRFLQRFREENCLLFVSHDASAILSLCDRAMLLDKGEMIEEGNPKKIVELYSRNLQVFSKRAEEKEVAVGDEAREIEIKNMASYELSKLDDYKNKWVDYRIEAIRRVKGKGIENISSIKSYIKHTESFGGDRAEIKEVDLYSLSENRGGGEISGGSIVKLTIITEILSRVSSPIVGFILKNNKGLELIGDNTC